MYGGAVTVRLAIVGSRGFSQWWGLAAARGIVEDVVAEAAARGDLELVVSGGAEGVDSIGAEVGRAHGVEVLVIVPQVRRWAGPGGFQERNREIVEACTHLLCVRDAGARSYGSGWTADEAVRRGKRVRRVEFAAPE